MKPILYGPNEKAFDTNGIGVLVDAVECSVIEVLNGQYELTLRYPITGIHYKQLISRAIILAKPNPVSKPQPFRIYRRVPSSQGTVMVYARHVAYDLKGITVAPFSAEGAPAAMQALGDNAVTDCPFAFWTDKTTAATLSVSVPRDIWGLLGGSKGSVLDKFGGEYEFDRFDVRLWKRRGADRGASIRYGKNLSTLEQDENCANCYTGIYPYWQGLDGTLVQLPEKVIDAPGVYDYVRIKPVDFSQEWSDAPSEVQLRERSERYVTENQIGVPVVSLTAKHVDLSQTEEYKNSATLEQVLIGDTVSVDFADMNVSASSRVVATDFNVLLEIYNSTTLGRVKADITDTVLTRPQEKADEALSSAKSYADAAVKNTVDAQTQADIFNKLTNNGQEQGIYMEDGKLYINASYLRSGIIDAAVVQVVNLIAEKLQSVSDFSQLTIDGAAIRLLSRYGETCGIQNYDDGTAWLYFAQRNEDGTYKSRSQFGADRMQIGGTWADPLLAFSTADGTPRLQIGNTLSRELSWKANGDGTYTLIGT